MTTTPEQSPDVPTSPTADGETSVPPPRKHILIVFGTVLVLCVGIFLAAVFTAQSRDNTTPTPTPTVDPSNPALVLPQGASRDTGLGVKVGTSGPQVDIFEDFQCPACAALQREIGPGLSELVKSGRTTVVLRPMVFLDQNLQNDASTRATNAFGCAADQGNALEYHSAVFRTQNVNEGAGFTDTQLLTLGEEVGVPNMDVFTECVTSGVYVPWAQAANTAALEAGVQSTPTVAVNGSVVNLNEMRSIDDFFTAIQEPTPAAP